MPKQRIEPAWRVPSLTYYKGWVLSTLLGVTHFYVPNIRSGPKAEMLTACVSFPFLPKVLYTVDSRLPCFSSYSVIPHRLVHQLCFSLGAERAGASKLETRVSVILYHALKIRRIGCNMCFARLICGVALYLIHPRKYTIERK